VIHSIVEALERHYGRPAPPATRDPFEQILWESVCYLVDDDRRAAAFEELRSRIGLTPAQILAASTEVLEEIVCGMKPRERVERLREVARVALDDHGGEVGEILGLPTSMALKALTRFPGIGEPGAERILLFAGVHTTVAPDSNALRTLLRLGVAPEGKSYQASYRAVRGALAPELHHDPEWLIAAHQLLRRHGKETCRRSAPECDTCPVRDVCAYYEAPH
jgi:endonuclease-3